MLESLKFWKWDRKSKAFYRAEISDLRKMIRSYRSQAASAEAEVKSLERKFEEKFKPLWNKLYDVSVHRSMSFNTPQYMVQVAFDSTWVEQALIHGNSDSELDFMCDYAARDLSRKMRQIWMTRNFVRFGEES